jgi:hypothetical protein
MRKLKTYESFIAEGRSAYDGLASKITSAIFKKWVKSYSGGSTTINYEEDISGKGLVFEVDASLIVDKRYKGFTVLDSTGADGRDDDDDGDFKTPFIIIHFGINPDWLPGEWSEVYMYLADVVRHEMEHITQDGAGHGNYRMGKPNEDDTELRTYIKMGLLPKSHYMMLPKEVDANLQGLRYQAKKRRESMLDSVNRYLDAQEQGGVINGIERKEILTVWRRRSKKIGGIPKF